MHYVEEVDLVTDCSERVAFGKLAVFTHFAELIDTCLIYQYSIYPLTEYSLVWILTGVNFV